jgi:hypothetical protein
VRFGKDMVRGIVAGVAGEYVTQQRAPTPLESQVAARTPADDLDDDINF